MAGALRRFVKTLQARLLLALLLIALLPLLTVGVAGAAMARSVVAEESSRELEGLARGLAGQLDTYLAGVLATAHAIAAMPEIASMNIDRQALAVRSPYHQYPQFARLSVFDLEGQRIASSHPTGAASIAHRQSFQTARTGRQDWEVAAALSTGRASLLVHTPIRDHDRQVVGVVGAVVDLETLSSVVGRVVVGTGGQAFVLNSAGRVLLHAGADATHGWMEEHPLGVVGRPAGIGTMRYANGNVRIAGYAPIASVGWTAVVDRAEADIVTPAEKFWRLALVGVAIASLLSLVAGVLLARGLMRPIRELVEAARALGAGDASVPLPKSGDCSEVGTLVDVFASMRKQVTDRERALREERERYRSLVEASPDAIVLIGMDGRILMCNHRAVILSGESSAAALIGRSILDFIAPDERQRARGSLERALRDGAVGDVEHTLVRPDGGRIAVEMNAAAMVDEARQAHALTAVIRDISARKEAESALRHAEDQLRQAQKMEAIGALAGGIAHDFNNMLTVIGGFSEIVLDQTPPHDPRRGPLREIRSAAERSAALTQQLLAFSRKQVLQPQTMDLNSAIADVTAMLHRLIGEDVELVTELVSDPWRIYADRGQVHQVLLNLVVNARDAMPDGGRLTIRTANLEADERLARRLPDMSPGRYAVLAVSDTGVGMDRATQARIFEPFFTTKEVGRGTGLGLATVYGIVKQSGGHIRVESQPGLGTTFEIYLPVCEAPSDQVGAAPRQSVSARCGATVLVVEDEPAVRALAVAALSGAGYRVLEASGPAEALAVCARQPAPPDLLLTDLVMPEMSGQALAQRVLDLSPETRLLFMSGYTSDVAARHGVRELHAGYLQKPFSPSALVQKVAEALGCAGCGAEPTIRDSIAAGCSAALACHEALSA